MSTPVPPLPPYKPYPLPGEFCAACGVRRLRVVHAGVIRDEPQGVDMPTLVCEACDTPDERLVYIKLPGWKDPADA